MSQQTTARPQNIPAHVAADQVVDFDLYADRRFEETGRPHAGFSALTQDAGGRGIFWSPRYGGHWFTNKHEIIADALRRTDLFSSTGAASLPPLPPEQEPFIPPLSLDPPEHIKYRVPLVNAFSPAKVKALEGEIRSLAAKLIDAVAAKGACEFVDEVAEPLPIIMFMNLMGLDLSRLRQFRNWIKLMMSNVPEERLASYQHITEMVVELIALRRKEPGSDLVSYLLTQKIDGRPFDDRELLGICILLFGAGLDTVVNALSLNMDFLARNPHLQDELRAAPDTIPQVMEEVLRVCAGVVAVRRVTQDIEFHGSKFRKGDSILLILPLANTDPEVFPAGDKFSLEGGVKAHMTFGAGIHVCVGAHLARLEIKIFFEEWFKRMPNVRLDPAHQPTFKTGMVTGAEKVPLVWSVQ